MHKTFLIKYLAAILLTLALPVIAAAEEKGASADEAAILKMERDWATLVVKGDTAALAALPTRAHSLPRRDMELLRSAL